MSSDQRIILIGEGATTQSALAALRERFDVAALVRSSDDEVSREARAAGIRVESRATAASIDALVEELKPDAVVVSSYNRILPATLIDKCPFVNVHYAPLPCYRGRATVNWAIINGETETAVTVHSLEPALDAGGILAQEAVAIGPRETVGGLYRKLNDVQRSVLAGAVERRLSGDKGFSQDESRATYTCTRLPSDGIIDWSSSTVAIDRLIRSLGHPFPPAYSSLGRLPIEVHSAEPGLDRRSYVGRIPGRVLRVDRMSGEVDVMTGDGVLTLRKLALPGQQPEDAARIVKSVKTTFGHPAFDPLAGVGSDVARPATKPGNRFLPASKDKVGGAPQHRAEEEKEGAFR